MRLPKEQSDIVESLKVREGLESNTDVFKARALDRNEWLKVIIDKEVLNNILD